MTSACFSDCFGIILGLFLGMTSREVSGEQKSTLLTDLFYLFVISSLFGSMYITRSLLALTLVIAISLAVEDVPLLRMPLIRNPQRSVDLLSSVKQEYRRLMKRDPFQTPLYNDQGSQYLIQVGIGTPSQNFTVTLDTGR